MKKTFSYYFSCWGIALFLFQVCAFVIPGFDSETGKFTGGFFVGYLFITLAFLGQLLCAKKAFAAPNQAVLFLRIPLIRISFWGLAATAVAGAVSMAIPGFPVWLGVITCLLATGTTAVAVIGSDYAAEAVDETDTRIRHTTSLIRTLTAEAHSLAATARLPEIKDKLFALSDKLRYSDPVSAPALRDLEAQLTAVFAQLTAAARAEDVDSAMRLIDEFTALLDIRNDQCKLLKATTHIKS